MSAALVATRHHLVSPTAVGHEVVRAEKTESRACEHVCIVRARTCTSGQAREKKKDMNVQRVQDDCATMR
jgi:hypothetical protein